MKATGIIRRIDDLGRIVIPREVRRTLKIHEGDPMEIFIENGAVVFKPYLVNSESTIKSLLEAFEEEEVPPLFLKEVKALLQQYSDWKKEN